MTELEVLIDQQRREMRRPWSVFHWTKRSVAANLSLDFPVGQGSLTVADFLVEGVNAWLPWALAPIAKPEAEDRSLFIGESLSGEERARYHAEWRTP